MSSSKIIPWYLDCQPRPAQIEALKRSYLGVATRDNVSENEVERRLPHYGRPAVGWGHFMEMRVGKTPTALNEALMFRTDYGLNKVLVLSPNKYKPNWGIEMGKFGFDIPYHVFDSEDRKDAAAFLKSKGDHSIIVNYEALIQSTTFDMLNAWVDKKTVIIADESVVIKNNKSQMFVKSLALSKIAAVTRPLTGLPAPQGPHDLWAQLRFAKQLEGNSFYSFKAKYCEMGGFQGRVVKGTRNADQLNKLLDSCSFRGRRVDWATKIESDYEIVELEMTPEQRKAYGEMEEDFITWVQGDLITADQVMTKRMKMQQIASGFVYNENKEPRLLVPFEDTPKFKHLLERMQNEVRGKVFIVAHYTHTISKLLECLKEFEPAVVAGDQHMKRWGRDSVAEKDRFNNSDVCRVLIGQSRAIKYGATLMGNENDPCLAICYFENNYSLDERKQTEERPQGEGQKGAIHIWDYVSSGVERDVIKALQTKSSVADAIMKYYKS